MNKTLWLLIMNSLLHYSEQSNMFDTFCSAIFNCTVTFIDMQYMYISVFDKLIWCTIGPKSFLFGTAQLIMITCILSLTALTLC